MRGRVAYGLIAILAVAAARAFNKPLFTEPSYAYLLGYANNVTIALLQNVVLAAAMLSLLLYVLKKNDLPRESFLVVIASPAFITLGTFAGEGLLLTTLALAALALNERPYLMALMGLLLAAVSPAGMVLSLITLTVLLSRRKVIPSLLWLAGLGALYYLARPVLTLTMPSDILVLGGTSLFILLLATVGVFLRWNKKTYLYVSLGIVTVAAGIVIEQLFLTGAIAAAVLAGESIKRLTSKRWILQGVRNISVLLVACGLLFTGLSAATQAVRAEPSKDFLEDVHIISLVTQGGRSFVLSEHESLLRWYGVDASSEYEEIILGKRDIEDALPFLPDYVILRDKDYAPNLRFLIDNTDDFFLLYSGEYSVWKVIKG